MEELQRKKITKKTKVAWQLEMHKICNEISYKEAQKINMSTRTQKGLDKDKHNRNYIVEKIIQYMLQGMKKEEAIEKVMQEEKETVESFEYLKKAGLDLRVVFSNWANDKNIKSKMREMVNNRGKER